MPVSKHQKPRNRSRRHKIPREGPRGGIFEVSLEQSRNEARLDIAYERMTAEQRAEFNALSDDEQDAIVSKADISDEEIKAYLARL